MFFRMKVGSHFVSSEHYKSSSLKGVTRGDYHRPKSSADEGKSQPKKYLRLDQDRSQLRRSAARESCHRLKVSADRKSSRWEDHRLGWRWPPDRSNQATKRRKSKSLVVRAERGKTPEGRSARFGHEFRNWPRTASSAQHWKPLRITLWRND